jgi:1-deoxyxylulose-5-phosphate synthase
MDHSTPHAEFYNVPFRLDQFNGMPYRYLGASGLRVSNVGLGTWKVGYPETGDGSRVDEKTAFSIFDRAIELGVTFWDTANRYNNASGNSERIIGHWLKNNPAQRRNVILATKLSGGMDGLTPNHCGLSRANILDSVYASLERLKTDFIDLLYFHTYDPFSPIEESLIAIEDLVRQGLVRYFAVSNFTVDQLKAYGGFEKSMSIRSRIVAVQNQFDILNGESASHKGTLEYASANKISFVAWSPMARGLLTDKYLDLAKVGPGDRLFDEGQVEGSTNEVVMGKLHRLAALSREWGMELSQMVIAYMLTLPGMGPVIPSSSNVRQLESNAGGGKISLTDNQRLQIREVIK